METLKTFFRESHPGWSISRGGLPALTLVVQHELSCWAVWVFQSLS